MAPMAGLGLFWMGNWPPCTLAGVQKEDQTAQVPQTRIVPQEHFSTTLTYLINTLISLHAHVRLNSLPAESRSEFLEKLQRARSQVKPVTSSQPILSNVGPTKLTVGNWSLTCLKEGEIAIHNSDGQQATILKEDLPGFVFESNRGTKHSFTAETSLGEEHVPLRTLTTSGLCAASNMYL